MAEEEKPKILIDACATPALADHLRQQRGIDVVHASSCLPPAAPDEDVVALARSEGRVILTINAEDFRKLARANPGHPGLIILPSVSRAAQIQLGETVIDRILADIKAGHRPKGHVYDVDAKGKVKRYKLPK